MQGMATAAGVVAYEKGQFHGSTAQGCWNTPVPRGCLSLNTSGRRLQEERGKQCGKEPLLALLSWDQITMH